MIVTNFILLLVILAVILADVYRVRFEKRINGIYIIWTVKHWNKFDCRWFVITRSVLIIRTRWIG